MAESEGFKFSCPQCGQHFEADRDMIGMTVDCPGCGQRVEVPSPDGERRADVVSDAQEEVEEPAQVGGVKIAVIKRRESFAERWVRRLKVIGIGIASLCLFVGVCIIVQVANDDGDGAVTVAEERKENPGARKEVSRPAVSANEKVFSSVECLLAFLKLPNERRRQVLLDSLEGCPDDFKCTAGEYVVSFVKSPEDFISSREREEAMNGKVGAAILLGILGAASTGDSQSGVNAGLELGDMAYAELQEKAKRRWQQEIETTRNRLIEVARKYGIEPNGFEEALVGCER